MSLLPIRQAAEKEKGIAAEGFFSPAWLEDSWAVREYLADCHYFGVLVFRPA